MAPSFFLWFLSSPLTELEPPSGHPELQAAAFGRLEELSHLDCLRRFLAPPTFRLLHHWPLGPASCLNQLRGSALDCAYRGSICVCRKSVSLSCSLDNSSFRFWLRLSSYSLAEVSLMDARQVSACVVCIRQRSCSNL